MNIPAGVRRKIIFLLKIIVSFALMYFAFQKVKFSEIFSFVRQIRLNIIFLVVSITLLNVCLRYLRWKICISVSQSNFQISRRQILKSLFVGFGYSFIIPGGYADAVKMLYIDNLKTNESIVIWGLEKTLIIFTYIVSAFIAAIFFFKWDFSSWFYLPLGLVCMILAGFFFIHKIPFLEISYDMVKRFRNQIIKLLGLSFFFLFTIIIQYYLLTSSIYNIPFHDVLVAVPLILSANVPAITMSGLGLRENFAAYVFNNYGIPNGAAVGVSLTIFFINTLLPALIGIYLINRPGNIDKDKINTIKAKTFSIKNKLSKKLSK